MVKEDAFIHIRIDADLKEQFANACKYNGRNISSVIKRMIKDYINECGEKNE